MDWLGFSGKALDTDMTDEAAWKARPELEAQWKARQAAEKKVLQKKVSSDKKGILAAQQVDWEGTANELDRGDHKTKGDRFDTDMRDEEAWKARKTKAEESRRRKAAEAKALKEANAKFFGSVKKTTRSDEIDDNLMDEEEWNVRPDLVKVSAEKKAREQLDLEIKNAEIRERLNKIKPMVVVTSPFGVSEYTEEKGYIEPVPSIYSPTPVMPRSRDKHLIKTEGITRAHVTDKYTPEWFATDTLSMSGTFMSGATNSGGSFFGAPVRPREKSSGYQKLLGYAKADSASGSSWYTSNPTDIIEPDTEYVPRLSARFKLDPADTSHPPSWLPQHKKYEWAA